MKHYVFAGTFKQADDHARESGLDHGQWIYADGRHKLQGIHPENMVVHRIGTWHMNDRVMIAWNYYQELRAMHGMEVRE